MSTVPMDLDMDLNGAVAGLFVFTVEVYDALYPSWEPQWGFGHASNPRQIVKRHPLVRISGIRIGRKR